MWKADHHSCVDYRVHNSRELCCLNRTLTYSTEQHLTQTGNKLVQRQRTKTETHKWERNNFLNFYYPIWFIFVNLMANYITANTTVSRGCLYTFESARKIRILCFFPREVTKVKPGHFHIWEGYVDRWRTETK